MSRRESASPIPELIVQLQRQLEQFRSSHPHRTRLPETLWAAAVDLARQHGLYSVARPLRLDYTGLKRRLSEAPGLEKKAPEGESAQAVGAALRSLAVGAGEWRVARHGVPGDAADAGAYR